MPYILQHIPALLRHPITILLLGTILSAIIVPFITSRFTDRRLRQEARLAQAKTILSNNTLVDKQLNTIQTTFESFVKDALSSGREYQEIQRELTKAFHEQYKQFDEHAWWCYRDLLMQSKVLKLPSKTNEKIGAMVKQYESNLIESTKAIDPELSRLRGPKFDLPYPELAEARNKLNDLASERASIAGRLADIFAPF